MGLRPRFTKQDIKQAIEAKKHSFRLSILNRLELVGWQFVTLARRKTAAEGGFNDITGNLRSSIGFAIVDHGNLKFENYEGKTAIGKQAARAFMKELKGKFDGGYALIVVAGMEYAAAVESRGKDVITGSSIVAERLLKEAIESLKTKLS